MILGCSRSFGGSLRGLHLLCEEEISEGVEKDEKNSWDAGLERAGSRGRVGKGLSMVLDLGVGEQ